MRRRTFVAATAAALAPSSGRTQEKWPVRPVRVVVPFAAGGTTDLVARVVAPSMSRTLGQQIVVENRAGAGGVLGADAVAKAPRDGYSLGIGTVSTHAIGPALLRHPPYSPEADFTPIAMLGTTSLAIFVHPSIGLTVSDLVDKARAAPGQLNYGSPGPGSLGHLAGLRFCRLANVDLTHVPYRGSAPALQDLLAGRVHVLFDNIPTALSQVAAGTVRALAVTSTERSAALPATPTTAEAGIPAFQILSWTMLLGPARLAAPVTEAANAAANTALADTVVRARFAEVSVDTLQGMPADAARFLKAEIEKWVPLAKASGVVVD